MPVSARDWVIYFLVSMLIPAAVAYFCGCINGSIIVSKFFCRDDVRAHGSGNAGLTNFYRNYGARYALFVIAVDMLKMVLAVLVAVALMGNTPAAKLWAGLFCVLGHMFPVTYKFKGGKGILSSGMLLWLLDWRIALVAWGVFILTAVLTRYVSLGSVLCAVTVPVTLLIFHFGNWFAFALGFVLAALVIWAHRGNIDRLIHGTESKFKFKLDSKDKEPRQ